MICLAVWIFFFTVQGSHRTGLHAQAAFRTGRLSQLAILKSRYPAVNGAAGKPDRPYPRKMVIHPYTATAENAAAGIKINERGLSSITPLGNGFDAAVSASGLFPRRSSEVRSTHFGDTPRSSNYVPTITVQKPSGPGGPPPVCGF